MSKCAILGCTATSSMSGRRFYKFPMIKNSVGNTLAIIRARQQAWSAALNRPKFFTNHCDKTRVCDQHFISGKPAKNNDVNSSDWAPTLNLDYNEQNEANNVEFKQETSEYNVTDPGVVINVTDPTDQRLVVKPSQVFIVMDNPDNRIDFSIMCRLCTSENVLLINLYPDTSVKVTPSSNNILDIIERFTTIKISPTDKLPQKICQNCVQTLNTMLAFQNKCKRSDTKLQKMKLSLEVTDDQPNIKLEVNDDEEDVLGDDLMIPDMEQVEVIDTFKVESDDENNYVYRYETGHDLDISNSTDKPFSIKDTRHDFESPKITNEGKEIRYDFASFVMTSEPVKREQPQQKVTCYICGKLYSPHHLQFHMNLHIGIKPYQCNIANCESKFASPHTLRKHKKSCHSDNARLFNCDVCGRGFKSRSNLKFHRTYHFDPNIPCTVPGCGKLIRNSRALSKHMLVHSQERKFKCEICKKAYLNRYTLRIHKRVHTQEKPYSCFCGLSFAYKCLLKSHTEKYHRETNGKTN